jgi:hypothetical protein
MTEQNQRGVLALFSFMGNAKIVARLTVNGVEVLA